MTDFLVGFLCGAVVFVPIPLYAAFTRTARKAVDRSKKTMIAIHLGQLLMLPLFIGGLFLRERVTQHVGAVTRDRHQRAFFGYIIRDGAQHFPFRLARTRLEEEESPPTSAAAASDPVDSGVVRRGRDRRCWFSFAKNVCLR